MPPLLRTALIAALLLTGCKKLQPNDPTGRPAAADNSTSARLAEQRRLNRICGSAATYDRLKVLAFEEATKIRGGRDNALDQLMAGTIVRMENPVARSRDSTLGVTVCAGNIVFALPAGSESLFGGQRQLAAAVEYSVQPAADASGLVYQMRGAEPITYRLAAFDLPQRRQTQIAQAGEQAQQDAPAAASAAEPPPPPLTVQVTPPRVARDAPPPPRPPVVTSAPRAAGPAFNCAKASGLAERMICGDPNLARLDRAMSAEYYSALAAADPDQRAAIRATGRRFIAYRNRCQDEGCIARMYDGRRRQLRDIMQGKY